MEIITGGFDDAGLIRLCRVAVTRPVSETLHHFTSLALSPLSLSLFFKQQQEPQREDDVGETRVFKGLPLFAKPRSYGSYHFNSDLTDENDSQMNLGSGSGLSLNRSD